MHFQFMQSAVMCNIIRSFTEEVLLRACINTGGIYKLHYFSWLTVMGRKVWFLLKLRLFFDFLSGWNVMVSKFDRNSPWCFGYHLSVADRFFALYKRTGA